jgi:hypothetical protein
MRGEEAIAITAYNSEFTLPSSRWSSAGLSATSSSVTPLAENQERKRRALTAVS